MAFSNNPLACGDATCARVDRPFCGFAEDGDVVRVAAEAGDVALHPAQGGLLIHEAVVARLAVRVGQGRVRQEAQRPSR